MPRKESIKVYQTSLFSAIFKHFIRVMFPTPIFHSLFTLFLLPLKHSSTITTHSLFLTPFRSPVSHSVYFDYVHPSVFPTRFWQIIAQFSRS